MFSGIVRLDIIFFRGLRENLLASMVHKRNCGKVVEDFHQTKGLACFSVVKQVAAS